MKNNIVSTTTILLVCLSIVSYCEVYYVGPTKLSNDADHHLTLSQFVKNSSDYLRNDTQLIFASGNYSLESKFLIENVHSFSISVESILSSRAVIVCDHNGEFEFSNTTTVNVTGLDFVGCFENHVISVGHFRIEHSRFYGEAQLVNGTVLNIDESTATLDRVAFISTVQVSIPNDAVHLNLSDSCPDSATVVLSRKSITVISQSWFEGNNVGLGRVIENYDSDITILNTIFADNSAATSCYGGREGPFQTFQSFSFPNLTFQKSIFPISLFLNLHFLISSILKWTCPWHASVTSQIGT